MFVIRMKNPRDPNAVFSHQTTKNIDSPLHGHGLSIIETIVRKHNGTCQWNADENCFVSLIMLKYA